MDLAESNRPVVDVRISASSDGSSPVEGIALLDTGATMCFIDHDATLGGGYSYRYRSDVSIRSRGSTEDGVGFYLCYLEIVGLGSLQGPIPMASTNGRDMPEDSPEKPFVAIIGQDVLALLILTQDGPNRIFSLATPTYHSREHTPSWRGVDAVA